MNRKKALLIILDGWGQGNQMKSDAIFHANTPFYDNLLKTRANAQLLTDGEHVGLPSGQMGNSEVGHMNIGAGRVVYQDLLKINKAIEDGSFYHEKVLLEAIEYAKTNSKKIHLLGLVSEGGVHSSQDHLHALCDLISKKGAQNAYIHAITDGRDTDPRSGKKYIQNLQNHIQDSGVKIASVIGRYYAMDRDNRWERIKEAYDLLTKGIGTSNEDVLDAIQDSYDNDITDEFIKPVSIVDSNNNALGIIEEGDVVICFNFRTDRCREISRVLSQQDMSEFNMNSIPLNYVTMTNYDESFQNVNIVYNKETPRMTIGEYLSSIDKTQVRIAETEKYAHVTFFFSGGREKEFTGEKRILINSPKVATYDLQPEMSAPQVADAIVDEMKENSPDFICLNFANADMVGHTGIYSAIIKACETVDSCLKKVVTSAEAEGYSIVIIADHGNADFAINDDGSPNTAHSTNPVPLIVLNDKLKGVHDGALCDIAPTVLDLMGLDIPNEMSGKSLLQ